MQIQARFRSFVY